MRHTLWIFAAFTYLGFAAAGLSAAAPQLPFGEPGSDLSARYQALMHSRDTIAIDRAKLAGVRVLLVPGLLADTLPARFDGFGKQIETLESLGLKRGVDFDLLDKKFDFNTQETSERNQEVIARVIADSPKNVLLISHSKGSLDVLEALLEHPEIQAKVAGWFNIQGSVWGSAVADAVMRSWDRKAFAAYFAFYGGTSDAISELQREVRVLYMMHHLNDLKALSQRVRYVSYGSYKDFAHMHWTMKVATILYDRGFWRNPSDGLVAPSDAIVPFGPYIIESGVDHADTTIATVPGMDRAQLTRVALSLVLEQ